jgi:hypothetical protein
MSAHVLSVEQRTKACGIQFRIQRDGETKAMGFHDLPCLGFQDPDDAGRGLLAGRFPVVIPTTLPCKGSETDHRKPSARPPRFGVEKSFFHGSS